MVFACNFKSPCLIFFFLFWFKLIYHILIIACNFYITAIFIFLFYIYFKIFIPLIYFFIKTIYYFIDFFQCYCLIANVLIILFYFHQLFQMMDHYIFFLFFFNFDHFFTFYFFFTSTFKKTWASVNFNFSLRGKKSGTENICKKHIYKNNNYYYWFLILSNFFVS